MMPLFSVLVVLLLSTSFTQAKDVIDLNDSSKLDINQLTDLIKPGDVLIIGESHAIAGEKNTDQIDQDLIINALVKKYATRNIHVSVGMEFIEFTHQVDVDAYLEHQLTDDEFTKNIGWGQNPFSAYKPQIVSPLAGQGWTYGLNSPKALTSFVGKKGLEKIPTNLSQFLPPHFSLGSSLYKKHFMDQMSAMSGHGMNLEFYFQAQSVWDDTMAWKASEIMAKDPQQILVIIVGQFHVMYQLGLPSRLRARGLGNIKTLIQSSAYEDLNPSEVKTLWGDPIYGKLANFYW